MSTYASSYNTGVLNAPEPADGSIWWVPFDIVLPAALAVNDIIEVMPLHPGVFIEDFVIAAPQLDSNGAPTLAFSLGLENAAFTDLATVLESGLTFGRTANGSISRATFGNIADVCAAATATATGTTRVGLKVTTAAATAALAGKTVRVKLALRH